MGNLGRLAFIIGLAAMGGAAGCFISEAADTADETTDEVNAGGDVSGVLKSTLLLDTGCTAIKVGPRHLLTSARCVSEKPEYAPGKSISYKIAAVATTQTASAERATDAGSPQDAGSPTDAGRDAGTTRDANALQVTISEVNVHASYAAKCKANACAFGAIAASDAKDIAVIVLDRELDTVPTIPVDLDTVGQADPVLVVASGCKKLDGTPSKVSTVKTIAVPAKSVNHAGSSYVAEPQLVTRLNSGYIVTPARGWRDGEAGLCKNDLGGPVFRADRPAVVGVTANFTTFEPSSMSPVTLHATRTDDASKVGRWLESLEVTTIHSCGDEACPKREYDGGAPTRSTTEPADGGDRDAAAPSASSDAGDDAGDDLPEEPEATTLPPSEEYIPKEPNNGDDYDAGPKKKKKKATSGCSAAPSGMTAPVESSALGVGIALAAIVARRRRRG